MKKILLLTALFVSGMSAMAQTSVETAADLTTDGENTYTFESVSYSNQAYFKYTAPEDQGQLLTITKASGSSTSVSVTTDGTTSTRIAGASSSDYTKTVYPVEKGQTVYLIASSYSSATVAFNASVKACDVSAGKSCNDPVIAVNGEEIFVPSYYSMATGTKDTAYISYTATEDGKLDMQFASSVTLIIKEGCDGAASEALTGSRDASTGCYSYKYDVEANKTYIVPLCLYQPMLATFTITHPVEGASCDMPYLASTTEPNVLPAAAGKYWYQFIPEKSGYVVLTSDAALPGGTVKAYNSCSAYSAKSTVTGQLLMRAAVTDNDDQILINIEKAESTDADETFTLTFEDAQAGDSYDNPIAAAIGENTTPLYNGTYYYSITVPEGENKMINVDASEAGIQSSNTKIYLYESQYSSVANGQTSLSYEGVAGKTYVLMFKQDENRNGLKFTVSLDDIAEGDVASKPLPAVLGENNVAAGTVKYYSYTATKNAWLSVEPADPAVTVTFPSSIEGTYVTYYDTQKKGLATRIQATEGTSYLIKLADIAKATTFSLSEEDYEIGEVRDNPIEIVADTTDLPSDMSLNHWYKYVAPRGGKLTVSSDVPYESESWSKHTDVKVAINDGNTESIDGVDENYNSVFKGSFFVEAGDVAYINVITLSAQTDCKLICTITDPEKGEASSNPIELSEGEITIPETDRNNPIWYSVELGVGDSICIMSEPDEYFNALLYAESNLENEVKSIQYSYDEDTYTSYYYLSYKKEDAGSGKYLICINGSYAETTATVTITRGAKGNSRMNPIEITADTTDLAKEVLNTWYLYTAPKDGKLTVNADIALERDSLGAQSTVEVTINNGYPQSIAKAIGQYGSETIYEGTFFVSEGDSVLINVVTLSAQADRKLTCILEDIKEGETSSKPIELQDGEITIPAVSRNTPVWYSVTLESGDSVSIVSDTNTFFAASLYESSNLDTEIAYSATTWSEDYTESWASIAYKNNGSEPVTYLICVYDDYNVETKAIVDIVTKEETTGVANMKIANGDSNLNIYDLNGRKVFSGKANESVRLNKGLYIINGKKVVVK